MHRYCLKTTNVKLVQNFSQYLNPIKWLLILNSNNMVSEKYRRNVLNTTGQCALTSEYQESHKLSQKHYQSKKDVKFSTSSTFCKVVSEYYIRFLCWTLLQMCWRSWLCSLWKIDSNLWDGRAVLKFENINLLKIDGVHKKPDVNTLILSVN